jgi:hypothetical protein
MINQDFYNLLDKKYKGIRQVKNEFPDEYEKIILFNEKFGNLSWGQKLYNYVNNITELPTCICGNPVKFNKYNQGYS